MGVPGHDPSTNRTSLYNVPTRDSAYDASSLDYRPVSHGESLSRGFGGTGGYNARQSMPPLPSMQHANNSGTLSLADRRTSYNERDVQGGGRRQSYGPAPGSAHENRKSMQVHVGIADDSDDVPSYGYATGQQGHGGRRRESAREREYAY
jgi:hypothetical protein